MSNPDIKQCAGCGEDFERPARMDNLRWQARRYCTRRCGLAAAGAESHGNGCTASDTAALKSAKIGSQALLTRSIIYGLKHDSDLGMGYQAFMARARELGLAA